MKSVKAEAEILGITLLYNAIYSSELNPVEYLWKLAKDQFRRDIILEQNYSKFEKINGLVINSINEASRESISRWTRLCVN